MTGSSSRDAHDRPRTQNQKPVLRGICRPWRMRSIISLRSANRREIKITSKISKRPTILMPTADEDKVITAAARSDPDA